MFNATLHERTLPPNSSGGVCSLSRCILVRRKLASGTDEKQRNGGRQRTAVRSMQTRETLCRLFTLRRLSTIGSVGSQCMGERFCVLLRSLRSVSSGCSEGSQCSEVLILHGVHLLCVPWVQPSCHESPMRASMFHNDAHSTAESTTRKTGRINKGEHRDAQCTEHARCPHIANSDHICVIKVGS